MLCLSYGVLEGNSSVKPKAFVFPASFELVPSYTALNQMRLTAVW